LANSAKTADVDDLMFSS